MHAKLPGPPLKGVIAAEPTVSADVVAVVVVVVVEFALVIDGRAHAAGRRGRGLLQ